MLQQIKYYRRLWQRKLRRRLRRRYYKRSTILPHLLIVCLCVIIVFLSYSIYFNSSAMEHSLLRTILGFGLPINKGEIQGYPGWTYTLRSVIYLVTDYDLGNPRSLFDATFPMLTRIKNREVWEDRPLMIIPELAFAPEPVKPDLTVRQEHGQPFVPTQAPLVLLYHTHSSEMYLGPQAVKDNYRNSHYVFRSNTDPKITGVMEVGNHLAKALQSQGISVMHHRQIHDWPSLASSYLNSERTVREILQKHPSIKYVLDIHRDANVPEPVVIIDGKRVAKVVIVVGTAQDIPQAHPNWQRNLEFAQKFYGIAEQMYPGLMRPLQVRRDARYNQHLSDNSLVIEIGSVENTLEEALLSAELIATILAQIIKQDNALP
ncbi:MAG: stage II sporulation protein P [Firmicutes bacterium]|nr:stage II sporulation protein P [Bacillota bacterium]